MKWFVRCSVLIFAIVCGVKAMPVIYVSSGDNVSTTVRYVALGDSIAYGYGLDDPDNDSYVGKVKEYLEGLSVFEETCVTRAGSVISSHCGPGTLGVLFISLFT